METLRQILITGSTDIRTYIALGALIFAIIAYRRHKRKMLAYDIITNTSLLSIRPVTKDEIKIYVDDAPVEGVNLVLIRIYNPGNDAITTKDFESPIGVNFGFMAKILSAEISEKSPVDLPAKISYNDTSVELKPLLLNVKDSIMIKALVSRSQEEIIVSGRIAGVNKIEDRTGKDDRVRVTLGTVQVVGFSFVAGLFLAGLETLLSEHIKYLEITSTVLNAIRLIAIAAITAILYYTFWIQKRKIKR
jgi:hypothetical protein